MTAKRSADAPRRGNQVEYAKHRGVSKVAVNKAIKAGRISIDADGKIDFAKADAQWSANSLQRRTPLAELARQAEAEAKAAAKPAAPHKSKSRAASVPAASPLPASIPDAFEGETGPDWGADMPLEDGQAPSLAVARAWRETYQARLARLKLDEAQGKLIDAEKARLSQFNLARKARDMLMGIADRLAPVLAGESDPFAIHTLLNDEHRRICNEIATAGSH